MERRGEGSIKRGKMQLRRRKGVKQLGSHGGGRGLGSGHQGAVFLALDGGR